MEIQNISAVYFSATYTTRKVVRHIVSQLKGNSTEHDITLKSPESEVLMSNNDLLVVGMPVYSGRIPNVALAALNKFKGNDTPAIIVCAYGNRAYDDSLLELNNIVKENGFKVVSAGAFIAQHSIFPAVGTNRPNSKDMKLIADFSKESQNKIASNNILSLPELKINGNYPYKEPGKIPLHPRANRKCTKCGACVKLCPVSAIPADSPRKTYGKKCIACGRCIVVCPENARHFGGLIYKIAGGKFIKAYSSPQEPTWFI